MPPRRIDRPCLEFRKGQVSLRELLVANGLRSDCELHIKPALSQAFDKTLDDNLHTADSAAR